MILLLLQAICLWTMANAGWDVQESQCNKQAYTDRNEIGERCHGNTSGGEFWLHVVKQAEDAEDEMEVVRTIQVQRRKAGSAELTRICLTFTDGTTKCTGGAYDHYDHVSCPSDLELPATHRLHGLRIYTNGRNEKVAVSGIGIDWTDPAAGAGGIQSWNCGDQSEDGYRSAYVDNNPGKYQLAGFYGRVGWWMDQLGGYLYDPPCKILSREIIDIQCANAIGERRRTEDGHVKGECAGNFDPTTASAVDVNSICENCDSGAEALTCAASFSVAREHEITVTDSHTDSVGGELSIGVGFEFDVKIFGSGVGSSVESSVSVNYEHTWESSKSQRDATITTVASTCTQTAAPGTISTLGAEVMVGEMTADFIITYKVKKQCGEDEIETFNANALMKNVASTEVVAKCSQDVEECSGEPPSFKCQIKINEAWQGKHNFENQPGYPLNMFDKYPYFDVVTGTWPNQASKEDFQKYFKCFEEFPVDCAGLQFPTTCHTPGLCTECFVIQDTTCAWDKLTGGYCVGNTFGTPMDINAAKAACLLDSHCQRIQCDNSAAWDAACLMCDGNQGPTSEPWTVYAPQSDCGNAQRSLPEAGQTDPPTMQITIPNAMVCSDYDTKKKCKKAKEVKTSCEWHGKTNLCHDLRDCANLTVPGLCKRSPNCLYIKKQCKKRIDCSGNSRSDCNEKAPMCVWYKDSGTKECKNREDVPCSYFKKEFPCTKYNKVFKLNCAWDGSSCA